MMGRMMGEYFLPLLGNFGFLDYLKHDPDVPDSDVTAAYCAEHNWIIGSPDTVVEKLEKVDDECGGFGQILVFGFDYSDDPAPWLQSLTALQEDVLPRVAHLVPAKPEAALTGAADDTARRARSVRVAPARAASVGGDATRNGRVDAHRPPSAVFASRRHVPNPSSAARHERDRWT